LQTIDRPTQPQPSRARWVVPASIALAVAAIPVLLLAIFTRWGVLVLLILAVAVGLLLMVRQRGILFIEVVAFLIHFDGIGTGPVRMGRFVAGFAALLMLYKLVVQRWRPPAIPLRTWAPIWALFVWATVSALWAADSGTWVNSMFQFMLGLVYFAITALLIDSHKGVHQFLRAYWIGGLFGSAVGVAGLVVGGRSAGFNDDPNFFGLLGASMIPLTVYYRRHATTPRAKALYTFALIMVLGGAAGAGSRSGLIGAAIAIVGTLVTRPGLSTGRRSRVAVGAVVLGALAFAGGFVANPSNLDRGFADRGAGRLDFLTVSLPLIKEQPIIGHGFGQLRLLIPPQLRLTPGSQQLDELREDVSSHNTYIDTTGDLGVIGLFLFGSVVAVAIIGLVRPRWLQLKELSTTVMVMFLPVMTGAFFLPLLNNKLAWGVIGLSAAMQVPSWRSRWSGLAGATAGAPLVQTTLPRGIAMGSPARSDVIARPDPAGVPGSFASPSLDAPEPEERLARWDLRVSRRAKRGIVLSAVAGGLLAGIVAGALPTHYSATAAVVSRRVDTSVGPEYVSIDRERLQGILTLVVSGAYAVELQRLSGVDLTPMQIRDRMAVTRPRSGNIVQLVFSDTSLSRTEAMMPYLVPALENIFAGSRAAAEEQVRDEVRPAVPGEQRYYEGAYFTPAYSGATLGIDPPPAAWMVFVGALGGGLSAIGYVFAGSRRARIESADDFPRVAGLPVWTHVGSGSGRRRRATGEQFAQLVAAAVDSHDVESLPSRVLVTAPTARSESESRQIALGVAAALVADGRRVVLVDAQLAAPRLSRRLARNSSRGLADLDRPGASVADVLRPVSRHRMPKVQRQLVGSSVDQLRFIPAGTRSARSKKLIRTDWLEQLDPDVAVVVLAPPTLGDVPVSDLLEWSDAVVLALVVGRTTTADAEDAAGVTHLFAQAPCGIVLVNV